MVRRGTGYLTEGNQIGVFCEAKVYRQHDDALKAAQPMWGRRGVVWSYLRAERVEHDAQKGNGE